MGIQNLSVLIMTFNEELHIRRCIESVKSFAKDVFVIDSFSTDKTIEICRELGVNIYQNPFKSHADQFNWGLKNCNITTDWVMRLDADEYVLSSLANEICGNLVELPSETTGIYVKRRVLFQGKWIRHGGYYPTWLLRIWRRGKAFSEERMMDEHIKLVDGTAVRFAEDIVDENLQNLSIWTNKHNNYSTKEAFELLNTIFHFIDYDEILPRLFGTQAERKRWLKNYYAQMPVFVRPFIYFIYRYFIRFGFLDGNQGLVWHFLQGFWYRFLVDAKIYEIRRAGGDDPAGIKRALKDIYAIEL